MMGLGKGNGTLLKWPFWVSIRSISGEPWRIPIRTKPTHSTVRASLGYPKISSTILTGPNQQVGLGKKSVFLDRLFLVECKKDKPKEYPKPLLWLKTPKLSLLGKNQSFVFVIFAFFSALRLDWT